MTFLQKLPKAINNLFQAINGFSKTKDASYILPERKTIWFEPRVLSTFAITYQKVNAPKMTFDRTVEVTCVTLPKDHLLTKRYVIIPQLPGLLVHALPVLNHNQIDHSTKQMECWCIATVAREPVAPI